MVDSLVRPVREVLTVLLFVAVTLRLTQRIRRASPPMRRTLTPLLVVAAIRCRGIRDRLPDQGDEPRIGRCSTPSSGSSRSRSR